MSKPHGSIHSEIGTAGARGAAAGIELKYSRLISGYDAVTASFPALIIMARSRAEGIPGAVHPGG